MFIVYLCCFFKAFKQKTLEKNVSYVFPKGANFARFHLDFYSIFLLRKVCGDAYCCFGARLRNGLRSTSAKKLPANVSLSRCGNEELLFPSQSFKFST